MRNVSLAPLAAGLITIGCFAAGCSGSTTVVLDSGLDSTTDLAEGQFYFGDPHFGGASTDLRLVTMSYGRLVDVFALDSGGARVSLGAEFMIDHRKESVVGSYELSSNPVTGRDTLLVRRDVGDEGERSELVQILRTLANDLAPIQPRGVGQSVGIFSMVPRNAAVMITFNDLLDASTVDERTVQVLTGLPSVTPFNARVFCSQYFGGSDSSGSFRPTRVIVDFTISELELAESGMVSPVNALGLPASVDANLSNAEIRLGTRTAAALGLTHVVANVTGHALATTGNGPVELGTPTQPIVRAFRSGGDPRILGDPFNGFLADETPPTLVESTNVTLTSAPVHMNGAPGESRVNLFRLPEIRFAAPVCASRPEVGDVIRQGGVFATVEERGIDEPLDGAVFDVLVRLIAFPSSWSGPEEWASVGQGAAAFESAYDAAQDAARAACFVAVSPRPNGFPSDPTGGLRLDSVFSLRFSEPMDPDSLTAFDSLTLTRVPFDPEVLPGTSDYVVSRVGTSVDLRDVTLAPDQLLAHVLGSAEPYYLRLASGEGDPFPPRDIAGNLLVEVPEIEYRIDPGEPTSLNGGRVHRFTSADEEAPVGSEFGGQILIDVARQRILPRSVSRTQVVVDNSQPMMQQMNALPGTPGLVTPHSPYGSKLQTIWRYADCGFALSDPQDMNIDIEGLSWAPDGGSITPDAFQSFEMRLAHASRAPDEFISPATLFPLYPNSGLSATFAENVLQSIPTTLPSQVIVHERQNGYVLDQGNLFVASSGTTMLPFPMNQGVPFPERRYYTWRDADIRSRGGVGGAPSEPRAYRTALGLPANPPVYQPFYTSGNIQTAGLPLLMEFRTFPDSNAIGLNGWDFNIAVNTSAQPFFRVFSTGGQNQSGAVITVDPANEAVGQGGFDPTTTPPGAPTLSRDPVVHIGAIDYVTRVSHSPSIWFEATIVGAAAGGPTDVRYRDAVVEPGINEQPTGTDLFVRFRGATAIQYLSDEHGVGAPSAVLDNDGDAPMMDLTPGIPDFQVDAFLLDLYGDYYNDREGALQHNPVGQNPGITFLGGDDLWRDSVDQIQSASFYQMRLTFVGNPENGQSSSVSALALTWSQE